jgi:hypothetical protein
VSLAEMAEILHESLVTVSRFRAAPPPRVQLVHFHNRSLRHQVREHAVPAVAHAVRTAAAQAVVMATGAIRTCRRAVAG